jgi:membrane-associated phospholipid phosphatase
MSPPADLGAAPGGEDVWAELGRLDLAGYAAVAATPTPALDRIFHSVSRAADHSKLWICTAAALATLGGGRGRRAALNGLASIGAASIAVNAAFKPLSRRRRPDRDTHNVPLARQVKMPGSTSFPSGHSASAFAFATGVAMALPAAGIPLGAAAAIVAYSRVHTGVHYPVDVIAGSVVGVAMTPVAISALDRLRARAADSR